MRRFAILWAVLTLVIAVGVGVGAYQWGLHDGLSQQIRSLPTNTVPAPGYGYPYYGPHWGFGFGFFPFFGFFPLFGLLFFLLLIFFVFRPGRWWYGAGGPGPGGGRLDEWHRRAHEGQPPADRPTQ